MTRIFDPTLPPEGKRLLLADVATRLQLSVQDLANALDLSRTVAGRLYFNEWPARVERQPLVVRIRAFLASQGATEREVATLFHAKLLRTAKAVVAPKSATQEVSDMLLSKQTLSYEARKKFNVFLNPFDGRVEAAEQMFRNGETRFVDEVLWQTAATSRLTAVVGESGSGKSTIVENLLERIETEGKPVVVITPSVVGMEETDNRGRKLKANDILISIIKTFNPAATLSNGTEVRTRQAHQLLADSTKLGNHHLLIIEEAHGLPIDTLRHLKRLHERMQLGRRSMLGILLVAHPELREKLSRFDLRELAQRLEVVELPPLDSDLKPYLQQRAKRDGKELQALITDCGIEAIREKLTVIKGGVRQAPVSLVYPLAVNNVMTASLNAAARIGAPIVNRDVVRAI